MVPPDHALAKHNKVSVSALVGQNFVGYERDISTRKASDRILRDYGVKPQYTMEFDNIETIKRAVEIGLGCAIVPRLTVENEMARGSLKMIEFQEGRSRVRWRSSTSADASCRRRRASSSRC